MSKADQLTILVEQYLMPRFNDNLLLMQHEDFKEAKKNGEKEFLLIIDDLLAEFCDLQVGNGIVKFSLVTELTESWKQHLIKQPSGFCCKNLGDIALAEVP